MVAESLAVAQTMMVYSIAPAPRSFSMIWATLEAFCPMATYTQAMFLPA